MKRLVVLFAACVMSMPGVLVAEEQAAKPSLTSSPERVGYAMGTDIGRYFKALGEDINFEALVYGITDGYTGVELALSPEEIVMVQKEFGAHLQAKQAAELQAMKEKNLTDGKAYLDENAKKEGVVVTASGLQYKFVTKGEGEMPTAADQVKVHYIGSLIDGTEFDSSVSRGEPVIFGVGQVIPGWSEALQLIPVGSKVKLTIPSDLAYGEAGVMPKIEPNSVLLFEVDLLAIEGDDEAEAVKTVEAPKAE